MEKYVVESDLGLISDLVDNERLTSNDIQDAWRITEVKIASTIPYQQFLDASSKQKNEQVKTSFGYTQQQHYSPIQSKLSYQSPSISPIESDFYLAKGSLFNEYLLYREAINNLTESIKYNINNRDAYIERAMAYFELNQIDLALQDYDSAKKLTVIPPFLPSSQQSIMLADIYSKK